eukprot:2006581-Rhodomonas_salina.1
MVLPSRFPKQRRPDCRETIRLLGDSKIHQSTERQPIRTDIDSQQPAQTPRNRTAAEPINVNACKQDHSTP